MSMLEESARTRSRAKACATSGCWDGCGEHEVRRRQHRIVYAPYVISVVPDPVAVTREMYRVCRPGGRIVILNHFRSKARVGAWLERLIAPFTLYLGFKSDLDLPAFLVQADLKPVSIEKVTSPEIWSLVTCIKG